MTAPALRFAARELRHGVRGLRGFGVFLGCLALGVAAIAGVLSTASSIVTGLRADGREVLGGDLAIRAVYRDLDHEERADVERAAAELSHFAEMRTMARRPGRAAEASVLVELKAVDSRYPLFGAFEARRGDGAAVSLPEGLRHADGRWGALVEPSLVDRFELEEGSPIITVGGIELEVRGTIEREPDRAGSGGPFGLWPRVLVSLDALAESGLLREGSLVYHQYAVRLPAGARADAVRERISERLRDGGWQVRTYEDAAPGIQRMVERLGSFLSLVGLTALLVGGVGVGNAVRAWLDRRLAVIATLKCIGASRRVVFSTYLVQLTAIAGLGVLAGLAAGALAPVAVGRLLENLLPTPIALGVYPGVLALSALFGLLTAVTFTVWPLSRAQETPAVALFRGIGLGVRAGRPEHLAAALAGGALLAALAVASAPDRVFAAWFTGGAALTLLAFRGAGWAVVRAARALNRPPGRSAPSTTGRRAAARVRRALNRLPPPPGPSVHGRPRSRLGPRLRMAVSNLYRPGNATADVVLALGLGLTVLVTVALVEGNLRRGIMESLPEDAPAFFFIGVEADRHDRFRETVAGVGGTSRFRSVPFLRGRIVRVNGLDPEEALVDDEHAWVIQGDRGLSYAAVPPGGPAVAGEWWPEDYAGPPLLSVDVDVVDAFGLELGDRITLNVLGREITAEVRHVRRVEWQSMQLDFALLLSPEPMRRAPHGHVATVRADPGAEAEVERTLAREFPEITVIRVREALGRVAEVMGNVAGAARAVGGVTLLAGALVLAGAVAAGHRRRTYESVVLKVLGVRRRDVALIHAAEFGLLGLLAGAVAAIAGTVTAWAVVTRVLDQEWTFLPATVAATVGSCVVLTLALGLLGTWRALGEPASPHLRNE